MAITSGNGPLTSTQLAGLARATLDNAQDLLADAKVLLDASRWPRAYSLAILAAEEYGKFEACVVAGGYEPDDLESWKRFWRRFVDHKPKLSAWATTLVDLIYTVPFMSHEQWVDAMDKRGVLVDEGRRGAKAGFYVDFVDGAVRNPAVEFDEEAARETVYLIDFIITYYARSYDGDLTRLVSPPAELRAALGDMEQAKRVAGQDAASRAFLRFVERSLPTEDLSKLRAALVRVKAMRGAHDDNE